MSEVEMLGIGGAAILAVFLVVRAILGRSRKADDGATPTAVDAGSSDG